VKEELVRLLREALSRVVGTLIAAGILGALGAIYLGYGIIGATIVILLFAAVALGVLALSVRIRKAEELPITPELPPTPPLPIPRPPHRVVVRFIDRHDEQGRDIVELVIQLLEEGQCINLWGSGGVGKTTLAIEATHRVFPAPFSGGVIWNTADGRADYGLITLLDQVLIALGREDARTLVPDAKTDLVGYLLNKSMPCLLGLDNFETIAKEEQKEILGFLAGVSCPALLTSRMRLPQAQNIRVGPMTAEEADEFLQSLVEQSTERAKLEKVNLEQIAEVAEYNPMLMRWVVAQLEQAMRPQDVFDDIARGKGEAVDRIFGRTFRLLGDDGQMALLALALFVPTASREALAAVCGFQDSKDRVNEAIRTLAAFDVLDTAVEGDRLGIVALTRRLTAAQLKKDERTEGLKERFSAYFLAYAEAHPEVTKEDLDALDDERENLLAALDYAYVAEDWENIMGLRAVLEEFLDLRGYWDEAIKWGQRAAEAARRAQDEKALAIFAHKTGVIYEKRGLYDEAKDLYNQSLEIARSLGDKARIASSLHQLGVVALLQGDYQEGKNLVHRSLEIATNLGDQTRIAICLHNLGIIAQDQGDYQEAKDLYDQSLATFKDLGAKGEQAEIASCLHRLGMLAQLQGDYQEAKDLYNQSLVTFKDLEAKSEQAAVLQNLGTIAQDQGDYQGAKDLYNQSLEINIYLGDQVGIAMCLEKLGIIAKDQGDYQEAKNLYDQSLEIFKELGNQAGIAECLHELGILAYLQGDYHQARDLQNQSLNVRKELRDKKGIAECLHELGILVYLQGDYHQARDLQNQSLNVRKELRDKKGIAECLHQLGRVAEETGSKEEAARLYREALTIFEKLGSPYAETARRALARVTEEQPKE